MNRQQTRVWNLRLLEKTLGYRRQSLVEKIGKSANYVNQLIMFKGAFGNRTAEHIENAFSLDSGWLDAERISDWLQLDSTRYNLWDIKDSYERSDHSDNRNNQIDNIMPLGQFITEPLESISRNRGHVYVQSYELFKKEVAEEVRFMSVPAEYLRMNDLTAGQIKSIEMPDSSQSERVIKGDYIGIDVEWSGVIESNKYYAICIGGIRTIRRIVIKADESLILCCKNSEFPEETYTKEEAKALKILGRAVLFSGSLE